MSSSFSTGLKKKYTQYLQNAYAYLVPNRAPLITALEVNCSCVQRFVWILPLPTSNPVTCWDSDKENVFQSKLRMLLALICPH